MARQGCESKTIFDKSRPGTRGMAVPAIDVPLSLLPPNDILRTGINLPRVSEPEVLRHYVGLSKKNFSIETGMYPLGSCTMKYNPRRNEAALRLTGFANIHPEQAEETVQGTLQVMFELQDYLAEIMGMKGTTLAPLAGAHGEFAGISMMRAFHVSNDEDKVRRKILIPDSAHGTNPASAAMAGYEVVKVATNRYGNTDLTDFRSKVDETVAGAMITQPNTLGLFDTGILEVADVLHSNGALLYGDGANMNALLGKVKPGELGFDVMHINTHKALATPHGGGGPGAGPVTVVKKLLPFLPNPIVTKEGGVYKLAKPEQSIGKLGTWYGNFAVLLRAYSYIRTVGAEGLREVAENSVLSANYLKALLLPHFEFPFGIDRRVMHEVVLSGARQKKRGVTTLDFAKRLMDYGYHPPTIYFPQIVPEAMMIEPTETESRESLDAFARAMVAITGEVIVDSGTVKSAPLTTLLGRLDDVAAARNPVLRWKPQ